ncbi:hypothetical protein QYE76_024569 [Lolium multiflorum]|uniref:Uncharacterized protein n=1 Tax=Lolium multiflorum TaxID=4521 RepID=A0AAD8VTE5_LOLMU|nr:hypothetical protein QYE76_024569 [Lolium multiflorum]
MAAAAMTAMTPPVSFSSLPGSSLPEPKPAVCWITNHPPWLQLQQRHGQLDILYSNAGTSGSSAHAPLAALDLADFDRVMAANMRSKVAGVKHATCLMVPRHRGCILCTGSTTGMLGGVTVLPYSLSKATVVGVVRLVTEDLAHADVRMNTISPQDIVTPHLVWSLARANPGVGDETLKRMGKRRSPRALTNCASSFPHGQTHAAVLAESRFFSSSCIYTYET